MIAQIRKHVGLHSVCLVLCLSFHLVFKVISVEQVIDKSDEVIDLEFRKLEERLGEKPSSKE